MTSQLALGLAIVLSATARLPIDQAAIDPDAFKAISAKRQTGVKEPPVLFGDKKTPFEKLKFRADKPHAYVPNQPKKKIVCGLTVLEADPSIDPKMVVHRPESTHDFKIVRIKPPVCPE